MYKAEERQNEIVVASIPVERARFDELDKFPLKPLRLMNGDGKGNRGRGRWRCGRRGTDRQPRR